MDTDTEPAVDSLVSTEWLQEHLNDPDVRILDIRGYVRHVPDGEGKVEVTYADARDEYDAAHIPGAVYVDWTKDIVDPDDPVPVQIAPPERFAAWASALGISDRTHVVIYDTQGYTFATRLWWDFTYYSHDRVSILNGGWKKWTAEDRPTTADIPSFAPATFTPRPRPHLRKRIDEVAKISGEQSALLIDARPTDEWAGKLARGGRVGHIPGARNLPASALLDPATGTWKSDEELARLLQETGASEEQPVVAYCGGGVAATGVLFALHRTGHRDWANYDGSWNEWGPRTDLPTETNAETDTETD